MNTRLRASAAALTALGLLGFAFTPAMAENAAPTRIGIQVPADGSTVVAKPGDQTNKALDVQLRLIKLRYLKPGLADGSYGPVTTSAVQYWQKASRRPVTGVMTQDDYVALWKDTNGTTDRPAVKIRAMAGDKGALVYDIQRRLVALKYLTAAEITSAYSGRTPYYVQAFQVHNGLVATGRLTEGDYVVLWTKTKGMTLPTPPVQYHAQPGQTSTQVKDVQLRLVKLGYLSPSSVTGYYGSATTSAVKAWQAAKGRAVTGSVSKADFLVLYNESNAYTGPKIDARCRTGARVMCVNRGGRKLYYVVNGRVVATYDVRTGRPGMVTRPGVFSVYYKNANHVSNLYNVAMPYSMFFDGGEAVHYSADFAANGYGIGSHGCVNMRDWNGIKWLYGQIRLGDKVVVY